VLPGWCNSAGDIQGQVAWRVAAHDNIEHRHAPDQIKGAGQGGGLQKGVTAAAGIAVRQHQQGAVQVGGTGDGEQIAAVVAALDDQGGVRILAACFARLAETIKVERQSRIYWESSMALGFARLRRDRRFPARGLLSINGRIAISCGGRNAAGCALSFHPGFRFALRN